MKLLGRDVTFGKPASPPKITFTDMLYDEAWGMTVRDEDAELLSLHVTSYGGTDWASWTFNSSRVVEKAEELFANEEYFRVVTNGERDAAAGPDTAVLAKLIFGEAGGAHDAVVAKVAELFKADGLVDRNLKGGRTCYIVDGIVFVSESDEDIRSRVIKGIDHFVSGLDTKVLRARNSEMAKVNRAKNKRPALADEIDQRLAAADATTSTNLPIHARLAPALERGSDSGSGRGRRA